MRTLHCHEELFCPRTRARWFSQGPGEPSRGHGDIGIWELGGEVMEPETRTVRSELLAVASSEGLTSRDGCPAPGRPASESQITDLELNRHGDCCPFLWSSDNSSNSQPSREVTESLTRSLALATAAQAEPQRPLVTRRQVTGLLDFLSNQCRNVLLRDSQSRTPSHSAFGQLGGLKRPAVGTGPSSVVRPVRTCIFLRALSEA
jgi:hypothetical protein